MLSVSCQIGAVNLNVFLGGVYMCLPTYIQAYIRIIYVLLATPLPQDETQVLLYIGNNIQQILNIFDFRCLHHLHGASKHCMHLNILDFVVCIIAMELLEQAFPAFE